MSSTSTPDYLFATLFHAELAYMARKGYRKTGKAKHEQKRVKFSYSPFEHYETFVRLIPRSPTRRQVFDTYLSTFFQAWQPDATDSAYVAGFVPRMAMYPESIGRFFADYPDGRLISILRDPADWFASFKAHTKGGVARYADVPSRDRAVERHGAVGAKVPARLRRSALHAAVVQGSRVRP